jgi:tetratricopeptide (TPR) repeat protein
MQSDCKQLDKWWRHAAACGLLAVTAVGCGTSTKVDRAAADVEESSAEPTILAKSTSTPRIHGIRPLASAVKSLKMPAADRGVIRTATTRAASAKPTDAVQPIATALPTRGRSTSDAEAQLGLATLSRGQTSAAYGSAAVPTMATSSAPLVQTTPVAVVDASAALRQADECSRRGVASAAKGATFTARTEFLEALRLTAGANDARSRTTQATAALSAGLTALTEAEDFVGRTAQLTTPIDVAALARTHRTAPFVGPLTSATPAGTARQLYLRFACEQLAIAAGGNSTGSVALHGLGKIHAAGAAAIDTRGKAQTYYEAALRAAPDNFLAANDLAVLLGEDGQLERARDVLHAGLRRAPQPAMWFNLAAVHDRLGQSQLAEQARREGRALEQGAANSGGNVLPIHNVAWLDARNFAATSRPGAEPAVAPTPAPPSTPSLARRLASAIPAGAAAAPVVQQTSAALPVAAPAIRSAQRPVNHTLAY